VQVGALQEKGKAPLTKHQGDQLAQQIKGVPRVAARALCACACARAVVTVLLWRSAEVRGVLCSEPE